MTIAEKMTHHVTLSDNNVRVLVYQDYYDEGIKFIDEIKGEDRRWYRKNTLIFYNYNDEKYYSIYYDQGLTECQENDFWEQVACEVKPITVTKTEWRKVE